MKPERSFKRMLPIDSGWGWVVVAAAFFSHCMIIGLVRSFGIIFVELVSYYEGSKAATATTYALSGALSLFLAPVYAAVADAYTCRRVVMVGALLASLGLFIAGLSSTLSEVVLAYGIFYGIGAGAILTPGPIMLARYFEAKRGLASGIVFAGSGVGSTLLPFFIHYLIDTFHLHGALIILSGFALNAAVAGALYRPLNFYLSPTIINRSSSVKLVRSNFAAKSAIKSILSESSPHQLTPISESAEADPSDSKIPYRTGDSESAEADPSDSEVPYRPCSESFLVIEERENNLRLRSQSLTSKPGPSGCLELATETVSLQDIPAEFGEEYRKSWPTDSIFGFFRRIFYFRNAETGTVEPLLDLELLGSGQLWMLMLGNTLIIVNWWLSMIVPPRALEVGLTKGDSAILLSILGLADTAGRLCGGFAGDREPFKSRRLQLLIGCCIIGGFGTFFGVFAQSLAGFLI